MAKFKERLKARKLRRKGISVNTIASELKVAKSTVSLWVRDIILTKKQLEKLRKKKLNGAEKGRLVASLKQKKDRLEKIKYAKNLGCKLLSRLNKRELFVVGVALYWAEGTKKTRRVSFCNSDPYLIKLMIRWLKVCFDIQFDKLSCYVGINNIHKKREKKVKQYWSKVTGIPLIQFTKTSFKKAKNKKIYKNFNSHYGTLTINVRKPAVLYYDIIGYIFGLSRSKCK